MAGKTRPSLRTKTLQNVDHSNLSITDKECIHQVFERYEKLTTADVVEVKHGKWIDKWDGKYANPTYVCSNCGEKALLENYINELDQWRYRQSLSIRCPFCGAKMDGERRDT